MLLAHKYPSLTHSLDIWHKAKRLRKALAEVRLEMDFILITLPTSFCFKAGKGRGMQKIGAWTDKIVNHFWHCCEKAKGDTDVLKVCGIFLKAVTSL